MAADTARSDEDPGVVARESRPRSGVEQFAYLYLSRMRVSLRARVSWGLTMGPRLRDVPTRTYRTIVQRAEKKSETLRTTVPQVVAQAILDLQQGDELVWTVDPPSRHHEEGGPTTERPPVVAGLVYGLAPGTGRVLIPR